MRIEFKPFTSFKEIGEGIFHFVIGEADGAFPIIVTAEVTSSEDEEEEDYMQANVVRTSEFVEEEEILYFSTAKQL